VNDPAPLLEIAGLGLAYDGVRALDDVALHIRPDEAVGIFGANGAGKSSLLRAIIGLTPISAGDIRFVGNSIAALPPERRAWLGIGYAPEGRRVFPGMSVRENLEVACHAEAEVRERRAASIFALFPALAEHETAPAWQLSGGQQQMLAIGRALMNNPRLLLLDEPSLGLGPRLVTSLFAQIRRIAKSGTAVILAEQNVAQAAAVCDRGYVLQLGRVVHEGPAHALAADPALRNAFLGG
jgi:branched-chain amino acid transport system ATP-binding protein